MQERIGQTAVNYQLSIINCQLTPKTSFLSEIFRLLDRRTELEGRCAEKGWTWEVTLAEHQELESIDDALVALGLASISS